MLLRALSRLNAAVAIVVLGGCLAGPNTRSAFFTPSSEVTEAEVAEARESQDSEAAAGDSDGSSAGSSEIIQVVAQRPVAEPHTDFEPLPVPHFPAQGWWNADADDWMAEKRLDQGYTLVLPGIEGCSPHNISIAHGLVDGGHSSAIEIYDWTTGSWVLFPYHLTSFERNHEQARQIARRIIAYQNEYPGRPVRLIGHSGGGAMAVLVLEELPEDHKVTQAVLLSAALDPDHNLCRALRRTRDGIWNLHSPLDIFYLRAGTAALGTIDRIHTSAAGAVGFRVPTCLSAQEVQLYKDKLTQVPYQSQMLMAGSFGGHRAFVGRRFVKDWLAPLMVNYQ